MFCGRNYLTRVLFHHLTYCLFESLPFNSLLAESVPKLADSVLSKFAARAFKTSRSGILFFDLAKVVIFRFNLYSHNI